MPTVRLLCAALLILVAAGWAAAAPPAYTPPVISVPPAAKAPVVDGQVEPAEWAKAAVLSDFVTVGATGLPTRRTVVYMQYDANNFYLGALCFDPQPGKLKLDAKQRDGGVTADDSLEVFIDTVGQRKDVAHLAINAANVQLDSWNEDAAQDFKWTSATRVGADGWSAEIALPFARGIGPAVGDTWLINVARNAPGAGERSCWVPVQRAYGELDRLGTLIFSGPPFRVETRSLGDLWAGQNLAQFAVQSLRPGTALEAKLNARVEGSRPVNNLFATAKVKAGADASPFGLSYRVPGEGFSTVTFSLTDAKGNTAWRSAPYPLTVPPLSASLSALEKSLSQSASAWSRLPAPQKAALEPNLAETLTAWRALTQRAIGVKPGLSRGDYDNLLQQVQMLTQAAAALQAEVGA
ncbi:MAG TPA: carbohydrate binding family 9 domain-containing protein [Armatimonadota bacterium]|jgi:hypothetical protein